ncbi:hypothetical protein FALCPG4_001317 [Fusarium falciforme]
MVRQGSSPLNWTRSTPTTMINFEAMLFLLLFTETLALPLAHCSRSDRRTGYIWQNTRIAFLRVKWSGAWSRRVRNRLKALIGGTLFEKSGSNRARFKAEPPRRFHEGQTRQRDSVKSGGQSLIFFFFVRDRLSSKAAVVDQEDDEINTCGFVGDDLELGASLLAVDGDIDVIPDD